MLARSGLIVAVFCLAIAGSAGALAQSAPAKPAPSALPAQVKQGLDRMGTALRALGAFTLKADVTTEDVLETGQKLQSSALMTLDVRRPDRFLMNIDSERKQRRIYYDGKHLTVFSPRTGYYATVNAPPTIRETIKTASERYGFETPLADLFDWGTSEFPVDRIQSAVYAGSDRINGQACDHYAFRQEGVDWQLWINKNASALPCKMVIVNTDDPSQPETTALLNWSPGASFTDAQFTFAPPADARRIVLGQVNPPPVKGTDK